MMNDAEIKMEEDHGTNTISVHEYMRGSYSETLSFWILLNHGSRELNIWVFHVSRGQHETQYGHT